MVTEQTDYQSPLVRGLAELATDVILPLFDQHKPGRLDVTGHLLRGALNDIAIPMLPTALHGLDNDLETQRRIWNEAKAWFQMLEPTVETYLNGATDGAGLDAEDGDGEAEPEAAGEQGEEPGPAGGSQ